MAVVHLKTEFRADCTADMSPALQESALQRVDMFFGWVCDSSDLLAMAKANFLVYAASAGVTVSPHFNFGMIRLAS